MEDVVANKVRVVRRWDRGLGRESRSAFFRFPVLGATGYVQSVLGEIPCFDDA